MHKWGNPIAAPPNPFKEQLLVSAGITRPVKTLHGKEWTLICRSLVFLTTSVTPTPLCVLTKWDVTQFRTKRKLLKKQRKWLISWNVSWSQYIQSLLAAHAALTYQVTKVFYSIPKSCDLLWKQENYRKRHCPLVGKYSKLCVLYCSPEGKLWQPE